MTKTMPLSAKDRTFHTEPETMFMRLSSGPTLPTPVLNARAHTMTAMIEETPATSPTRKVTKGMATSNST